MGPNRSVVLSLLAALAPPAPAHGVERPAALHNAAPRFAGFAQGTGRPAGGAVRARHERPVAAELARALVLDERPRELAGGGVIARPQWGLVEWGGNWWHAKVLQAADGKYRIHYTGWADSWDEWVAPERLRFPRRGERLPTPQGPNPGPVPLPMGP